MRSLLADMRWLNPGSPEPSVSAEKPGPLQAMVSGVTFWAGVFRYWGTKVFGMCSFNAPHLYSFGIWGSYSFHLHCPWAGIRKPMQVGDLHAPALRPAPGPEVLRLSESAIRVHDACCDPRAG